MKTRESSTEQLLDIQQAATFLHVSQTSLRRWTNAGTLPCLRVGGRRERRFRRSDLMAFMENHGTEAPTGNRPRESREQLVCLHASVEERTSQAAILLANALAERRRCFLLAPTGMRQEILSALTALRAEVASDVADGWLLQGEAVSTVRDPLTYWKTHLDQAGRDGISALCVVTSMTEPMAPEARAECERRFHDILASGLPVQTLCLYDVRALSGTDVLEALQRHPQTLSPLALELNRQ